jgi:hypothetical protein
MESRATRWRAVAIVIALSGLVAWAFGGSRDYEELRFAIRYAPVFAIVGAILAINIAVSRGALASEIEAATVTVFMIGIFVWIAAIALSPAVANLLAFLFIGYIAGLLFEARRVREGGESPD